MIHGAMLRDYSEEQLWQVSCGLGSGPESTTNIQTCWSFWWFMGYIYIHDYVWMYDDLCGGTIQKTWGLGLNRFQRLDNIGSFAESVTDFSEQVLGKPSSRRRLAILQQCRGKQGQILRRNDSTVDCRHFWLTKISWFFFTLQVNFGSFTLFLKHYAKSTWSDVKLDARCVTCNHVCRPRPAWRNLLLQGSLWRWIRCPGKLRP